jgi:hypothetical protein
LRLDDAILEFDHPGILELVCCQCAMMLIGFAGLGFMAYRRTKKSAAV